MQPFLTFHNKIDRGSAEKVANYKVNGKAVKDVQLIEQTETTSVVKLTLTSGNIKYDASYPIKIDGIRGYNNSFGELSDYEAIVPLKENTPPTIEKAVYDNYNNRIEITFSEQINGIPGFSVYQSNHLLCTSVETRTSIIEDKVIIFLNERVTSPSTLTLKPENINSIKDINGNKGIRKTVFCTLGDIPIPINIFFSIDLYLAIVYNKKHKKLFRGDHIENIPQNSKQARLVTFYCIHYITFLFFVF